MKSIDSVYNRWCGVMAIVAGIITAIFWFVHPDPSLSDLQATQNPIWKLVHLAFLVTLIGTVFGLNGLLRLSFDRIGVVGFIGYVLATIGAVLFVGAGMFDGLIKPLIVTSTASDLLSPQGPIEMALLPIVVPGGLMFGCGFMILGVQIIRTGVLPKWVGALFLLTIILGLSPLMPVVVRMVGCAAFGVAMIMLGWTLLQSGNEPARPS